MSKYFVQITKKAYRDNDHIQFLVISDEGATIGGAWYPHSFVEHHISLGYDEKEKTGHGFITSKAETDHVVYFDLGDHYTTGFLKGIAEEIQACHRTYEAQYNAFILKLAELGFKKSKE